MNWGYFSFGFLWLLGGLFYSTTNCFISDVCHYNALIAPLPAFYFFYLAFVVKNPNPQSRFYFRVVLFAVGLVLLTLVSNYIFNDTNRAVNLSLSILVITLGILLINHVVKSFKSGSISYYREGVVAHGPHYISKNNRFEFILLSFTYGASGLIFIFLGLYNLAHVFNIL